MRLFDSPDDVPGGADVLARRGAPSPGETAPAGAAESLARACSGETASASAPRRSARVPMGVAWTPSAEEQCWLASGEAIAYHHDGLHEIVRLDALPKELASYVRQQERDDARKAAKEVLRKSAPSEVKISRTLAKAKGLL